MMAQSVQCRVGLWSGEGTLQAYMMALQMRVKVTAFTQLKHSGKGAAVQLKDVQQTHNPCMPATKSPYLWGPLFRM